MELANRRVAIAIAGAGGPSIVTATMASPTNDSTFNEELIADVEAYIHRTSVLTDFAESQVEERIRLARLVNELQLKISELATQIEALDVRLRSLDGSITVRLTRAPRRIWRVVRRNRSR